MLVRLSVENWMSFRDQVTFSMIATRERHHIERIPRADKYKAKLLPVAAIYGGNASGKSNLVKALEFVKEMVVKGPPAEVPIPVDRFQLDSRSGEQPARFSLEILINESMFEFSFSATPHAIIEEKLVAINPASETVLYHRHRDFDDIKMDDNLDNKDLLRFAFRGTRDNQLFLNNSVSQRVNNFLNVHSWFNIKLITIYPDSIFKNKHAFIDSNSDSYNRFNELNKILSKLDTGICRFDGETIPVDDINIPNSIMKQIKEGFTFTKSINRGSPEQITVFMKNGTPCAKKTFMVHLKDDGSEAKFEIGQESDGTQRILDLLPAFLDISHGELSPVFIIDELDRSLHTLLTRALLEYYLSHCSPESRSQLIFTTHDALLMDQDLLRRDEMWVTERDREGASTLYSFSEYKEVRKDKDIRKSYLQGRMGGIPRILLQGITPPSAPE